jgi:hypothetical protein
MKKLKTILTAVLVLTVVTGALAFKAKVFGTTWCGSQASGFCGYLTNYRENAGGAQFYVDTSFGEHCDSNDDCTEPKHLEYGEP